MSTLAFEYRAVDKAGAKRRGIIAAANQTEAFRKLAAQELTPLKLSAARRGAGSTRGAGGVKARLTFGLWQGRKVRLKDLAHFTYQLGVLMSSRIPLGDGLTSIAEQERDGPLKEIISDVARRIESGENIAAALEAHREAFGDVYIETIRAAEKGGNLVKVMEHLSDMLERTQEMQGQVRTALAYPICVVCVLGAAVLFLVGFVVPRFAKMFESRQVELPAFTRALMTVGESLQGYWFAYILGAAVAWFGFRRWISAPRGRRFFDNALNKVPHVGQILRGLALARFSRVLGLSISSGLGLIDSLELAGRAAGRARLEADVTEMVQRVRGGGRLAEALPSCEYLTPFTRRMLSAGEQSAELPRMCNVVARHYERESSLLAKSISTVIEPLLIVGIAVVVLVVALAIFMPMWDMVKLVG